MEKLKAKFIGRDGSMGFKHGQSYELQVWVHRDKIWIRGNRRQERHLRCVYSGIGAFLSNWKVKY